MRYRNKCDEKKEVNGSTTAERIEDFGPRPEPICGSKFNVMVGVTIMLGIVVV